MGVEEDQLPEAMRGGGAQGAVAEARKSAADPAVQGGQQRQTRPRVRTQQSSWMAGIASHVRTPTVGFRQMDAN